MTVTCIACVRNFVYTGTLRITIMHYVVALLFTERLYKSEGASVYVMADGDLKFEIGHSASAWVSVYANEL